MMKKVCSYLLCIVMVFGLVAGVSVPVSAEEYKLINSVDLTFNPPSVGTKVTGMDTLQIPEPSAISSTAGVKYGGGHFIKSPAERGWFYGTFEEGKTYYARLALDVPFDGEYRFAESLNVNVEGATFISVEDPYPSEEQLKGKMLTVVVSFMPKSGSEPKTIPEGPEGTMYRLYNSNSGEHFYTGDINEANHLYNIGWDYEDYAWTAPTSSDVPVYRLYNSSGGYHHYTTNAGERDSLVGIGWVDEGIAWYSYGDTGTPLYRLYNSNATGEYEAGGHHYTKDTSERDYLVSIGWAYEGVGWYGV